MRLAPTVAVLAAMASIQILFSSSALAQGGRALEGTVETRIGELYFEIHRADR